MANPMEDVAREALQRLLKPKPDDHPRHCPTCTCDPDFRARQRKLFRNTPTTGCLHHSNGLYCGEVCIGSTDYCVRHRRG